MTAFGGLREVNSRVFSFFLLVLALSISAAPLSQASVYAAASEDWSVTLTASLTGFFDNSTFGVKSNATLGFDDWCDQVDPPQPPEGVVSYFWYPNNPASPVDLRKLSVSYIAPGESLNWSYRVKAVGLNGNMTISWNTDEMASIPSGFSKVQLAADNGSVLVDNMRLTASFSFNAEEDTTYSFTIILLYFHHIGDLNIDGAIHPVAAASNSTITAFNSNSTAFWFNVSGPEGTAGYCYIAVPMGLNQSPYVVLLNGSIWPYTASGNGTHHFIHITYSHSESVITVQTLGELPFVPEFPAGLLIAILIPATLTASILLKAKKKKLKTWNFIAKTLTARSQEHSK
jgi:hypothetical protein